ncbi:hypothetical protein AKN94_05525 [Thiopseudomonas alkaliphila]|uniref:hypothetical protein n=1 Tax=Thiopseudomonas alkaliphila TaxID=1697053 RepID=UPI00069EB631|nr:hypothetical protein [Thiopseudomonas alkaliphila]AKX46876.1 hypothetical protein AKN94_05525 [Thiopseudomonas alkaliphila]
MYFKFLLVFFSAVMLAACGKPDTDLGDVQPAVAPKASSTAIFLPGGGGIDFGIALTTDVKNINASFGRAERIRVLYIKEDIEKVISSISGVLLEFGYDEKEIRRNSEEIVYTYSKEDKIFSVNYQDEFSEGFNRKVRVLFWHWDD